MTIARASRGIAGYGVYLPRYRLHRSEIRGGRNDGARTVAAYDEDTTSMAVEAARGLVPATGSVVESLWFATTQPAYADKSNASAIHAALGLPSSCSAFDTVGAVRSSLGAMEAAESARGTALSVFSDIRSGAPGSADEIEGGDASVALLWTDHTSERPVLAELLDSSHETLEVLERWRVPGADTARTWEERFGESAYVPVAHALLDRVVDALPPDGRRLGAVTGLHSRAVRAIARRLGEHAKLLEDSAAELGNVGAAAPGLAIADWLDQAQPGDVFVLVVVADGVSALTFRATAAMDVQRVRSALADRSASNVERVDYITYLTWRGLLTAAPARRPHAEPPLAPPSFRRSDWKFGLVASRCTECDTRQTPPSRVCRACHAVDRMTADPMREESARVFTFTIDRLAHTPSPPLVGAVIDFENGGRLKCEITDAEPDAVHAGMPVEMTFRRLTTARGVHNYFWKARPKASPLTAEEHDGDISRHQ